LFKKNKERNLQKRPAHLSPLIAT